MPFEHRCRESHIYLWPWNDSTVVWIELLYFRSKKKVKKIKRADPKDLRHEDSAAVWNELAYFKNENRNLVVER